MDNNIYLMFDHDTSLIEAQNIFERKYGKQPEKVFCLYPGREVLAGPIPVNEKRVE